MSDWDVLVLINRRNITFDEETIFMNAFYVLELETGEVLSPLIYSKNDWKKNTSTPHCLKIFNEMELELCDNELSV